MKLTLLIPFFAAWVSLASAQNPRIETLADRRTETYSYKKTGGDSIRFTILGKNDTFQVTLFNRNGKIKSHYWRKDSIAHTFSNLGQMERKVCLQKGAESTITYYANGQIHQSDTREKDVFLTKIYREDGLLLTTIHNKLTPSVSSRQEIRDRNNLLISSSRVDSLRIDNQYITREYDSIFYENGRLQAAFHTQYKSDILGTKIESVGASYFNPDGSMLKTVKADSLKLTTFKDNVDCYYGLKNSRGDTVVKPRFDHIEGLLFGYWAAYIGNSGILLSPEGAPLSPPSARLSLVTQLTRLRDEFVGLNVEKTDDDDIKRTSNLFRIPSDYYGFADGKKYGIMRHDGTLLMAPQYHSFAGIYIGDGEYFSFIDREGDSIVEAGYINRQGKPIFKDLFKWASYLKNDYFLVGNSKKLGIWGGFEPYQPLSGNNNLGVARGRDEAVILEPKFNEIKHLPITNLLLVRIGNDDETKDTITQKHGVFNPRTRKWIVDTSHFDIQGADTYNYNPKYFVLKNIKNNKYGIVDTTGKFLAPLSFDSIGCVNETSDLFWVKKGNKYHILTIEKGKINLHKAAYDFLADAHFRYYHHSDLQIMRQFIAKRDNKWGVVDAEDRIIKPFVYAYASVQKDNKFLLVKDNQAACFSVNSLPNETTIYTEQQYYTAFQKQIFSHTLAENPERVFFINDTGRVVIPPQYKPLNSWSIEPYILVEDATKNKKIILCETGKIIDYPFNYNVQKWHPKSRIFAVRDTTEVGFGAVSFEGQLVTTCENYGIALTETDESVYFVKRDTPLLQRYTSVFVNGQIIPRWNMIEVNGDTLNATDNNWMLYDATGKPLGNTPFRFPIDFKNGIGIGMKGDDFSLYKPDGSILTPFLKNTEGASFPEKYRNIRRDPKTNFYALFRNQGLTPTMILTKNNGQIIIESGRYDGISRFYGAYALVSSQGLIGLVDSFGREIIAPQDLRTYKNHFIDSLNASNKRVLKNENYDYNDVINLPIELVTYNPLLNPDSLNISPEKRAVLWNLMLEKTLPYTIGTASDALIPRDNPVAKMDFIVITEHQDMILSPKRLVVEDNTMAFGWQKSTVYGRDGQEFHNFYRRNNRWEALILPDLLNIQGEKRGVFNDLLIKKVRALTDAKIDCSNTSGFITAVENRFMLTKRGIDFCFNSEENDEDSVIVSFTQAELTPFLKLSVWGK